MSVIQFADMIAYEWRRFILHCFRGDIMFNLMAVVPDKRIASRRSLDSLNNNWNILSKELRQVIYVHHIL